MEVSMLLIYLKYFYIALILKLRRLLVMFQLCFLRRWHRKQGANFSRALFFYVLLVKKWTEITLSTLR